MAKKQAETPAVEPVQNDELAALSAQLGQALDMLAEQQQTIESLRAAQTGKAAEAVKQDDEQAKWDAELEALKAEFAGDPAIQVFERRVLMGKDAGSEIRLKDELPIAQDPRGEHRIWKLRWFNLGKEGRSQQATEEGYVKVRWDELQDRESVVADDKSGEFVRKGERGQEVLYKMRLKLWEYKKRRDAAIRNGMLTSRAKLQDHVANSVAAQAGRLGMNGSEAGDFAHQSIDLTITELPRETLTL